MSPQELIPLRWTGATAAKDLRPLNCAIGAGSPLPQVSAAELAAVTVAKQAHWPGIRMDERGRTAAGPTGEPWVNANGWRVQMLRAREGKPVWLNTEPPANAVPGSFPLAVADASAYGGRWVATVEERTWPAVQQALLFFEERREWRDWTPAARLGVISDFKGPNEFMGGEYLNLLSRRQIPYLLYGSPAGTEKMHALVWLDRKPVPAAAMEILLPWVRSGGLLLVPPGTSTGSAPEKHGHLIFAEGKGRIAVALKPWSDPYLAATSTHLLFSRTNDTVRLWNGGSLNAHYVEAPDRRRAVIHLLNYTSRPGSGDISLWTAKPYRTAKLTSLTGEPTLLKTTAANGGIEVALPAIGAYAALELEA